MKTASLIAPADPGDRFTEIDALRGFALFGILLANLPVWIGIPFAGDRTADLLGGITLQQFAAVFNGLLDGKFYTIFSALFGLGFSLQLERLEARGAKGIRIFRRRMAVLLMFGLIHICLIWPGDILMLYALMGFTLPLFRRLSDRALLLVSALLIFVVPALLVWLVTVPHPDWTKPMWDAAMAIYVGAGGTATSNDAYFNDLATGGFAEFVPRAASEWAFGIISRIEDWRFIKVLGTMLLGMWAGRLLLRGQLIGNRRLLWQVALGGAVIGVPCAIVYAQQMPHQQSHWSSLAGTAPLGLAYAATFLLAISRLPRVERALADAGRMALTNYVATSVVMSFLFYGIGLGMMGTLRVPETYAIGLAFFALMLAWSRWWLGSHRQGPLEWLWRRLTYPARSANIDPPGTVTVG
ncbi:DUF418 domain-containing protein [Sphingopyxis sp. XHP0097]|uniref:DUF418 domain-containing protein n=1 Tax=Sphingopyxis jiangsuensis TaxID=2871171 RepID=A0ABS7MEU4_9SPHN|nr:MULTISPECIES: DUF418 domain-containing protein [Sphingopyxis]MBL0769343.1 DUF418 domain-containing protein [Sphingopyxis lutea]MBY4637550.1 DUF418 domain-containing protein [Sphingopyxis jiangsuensis]